MKTTKESTKNSIKERLTAEISAKTAERARILAECKREKATTTAKIDALRAAQAEAENPVEYKKDAAQINELEDYIEYLDYREKSARAKPAIDKEEYKAIEGALAAEHKKVLEASAAQINTKFNELMNLMEEYTSQADELQSVLNTAQTAHFGNTQGGHFWHELKATNPDKFGFFEDFCQVYFNRVSLINEIKLDKRTMNTFSNPDHARIWAALHK